MLRRGVPRQGPDPAQPRGHGRLPGGRFRRRREAAFGRDTFGRTCGHERNNLGLVLLLAAKPCEAAGEFDQALALVERKLGRDNSLFRRIEGNLGRVHCP